MAFIDELKIHIKSGLGGDGVVRWLHQKGVEKAGPAGGNGGKGGDVYVRAIRDIGVLGRYKNTKEFAAENGQAGMKKSMHGKNGDDLIIDLPIGTILTNLETREDFNLIEVLNNQALEKLAKKQILKSNLSLLRTLGLSVFQMLENLV